MRWESTLVWDFKRAFDSSPLTHLSSQCDQRMWNEWERWSSIYTGSSTGTLFGKKQKIKRTATTMIRNKLWALQVRMCSTSFSGKISKLSLFRLRH